MRAYDPGYAVLVVESDAALSSDLFTFLDNLEIEVLGPVNNVLDALRLARDRQPRFAILDSRMDVAMLDGLHGVLPEFGVRCLDLSAPERSAAATTHVSRRCALRSRGRKILPSGTFK